MGARIKWTADMVGRVHTDYVFGVSLEATADALGVSKTTLMRKRKAMNIVGRRVHVGAVPDGEHTPLPEPQFQVRECMSCRDEFKSEGNHNRMCGACREADVSPFAPDCVPPRLASDFIAEFSSAGKIGAL